MSSFTDRMVTTLSNFDGEIIYVGIRSEMDRMPDELWPESDNVDSMVYPDPESALQAVRQFGGRFQSQLGADDAVPPVEIETA